MSNRTFGTGRRAPRTRPRRPRLDRLVASFATRTLTLLSTVAVVVSAGRESHPRSKTFRFKDDFFLMFSSLDGAIEPGDNESRLLDALDAHAGTFRDGWRSALELELEGGGCEVKEMTIPTFSLSEWHHRDPYEPNELPSPGQSYVHPDAFALRVYYRVHKLDIECDGDGDDGDGRDRFSYRDLDRDAYVASALAGNGLRDVLLATYQDGECETEYTDGVHRKLHSNHHHHHDDSSDDDDLGDPCLYSNVESVTHRGFNETDAALSIHRHVEIPMHLKCLGGNADYGGEVVRHLHSGDGVYDGGYGPDVAEMLVEAMDEFFEAVVEQALEEEILTLIPEGHVHGFASPYKNRNLQFFTHGMHFTHGGKMVSQYADDDGVLITEYRYGFDIIWFRPRSTLSEDALLQDPAASVNAVFAEDGAFLAFLKEHHSEHDYVQAATICEPIQYGTGGPPSKSLVTAPPTLRPTDRPTSAFEMGEGPCDDVYGPPCVSGLLCHADTQTCVCDVDSGFGCDSGRVCAIRRVDNLPRCYCDMQNDAGGTNGCSTGEVCRHSCAYLTLEPSCYADEFVRDCEDVHGDGFTCADSTGDGIVDLNDVSGGCDSVAPPTDSPTVGPTREPTVKPTANPTVDPTANPTANPTVEPTAEPTAKPTANPTPAPTTSPTPLPEVPTTDSPTRKPTNNPTDSPTRKPTNNPTRNPTNNPTDSPTRNPTNNPTDQPTASPTERPTTPSPVASIPAITPVPTTLSPTMTASPTFVPTASPVEGGYLPIEGTCGGGDVGDGICAYEGYCCSEWGWCGTTPIYCGGETTPALSPRGVPIPPTPSVDAGMCGGGTEGEGTCADDDYCCSPWGYCGPGENYCYTVDWANVTDDGSWIDDGFDGTCGAGSAGDGLCQNEACCSRWGFCGETALFCDGDNGPVVPVVPDGGGGDGGDGDGGDQTNVNSTLPDNLIAAFGFRCGTTEVDARSNCKKECTHHVQCGNGEGEEWEECWGVQLNYCHTFEEGTHPVCTNATNADDDKRCGYDEMSARGHCGPKCDGDGDCGTAELCFPTLLNLCDCFEEMDLTDEPFETAKDKIEPYFLKAFESGNADVVERDPEGGGEDEGKVMGKPRDSGSPLVKSATVGFFVTILLLLGLW